MNTASSLRLFPLCLALALLGGCEALHQASQEKTAARLDEVIARYKTAATQVRLGDSKERVLSVLEPTQFELLSNEVKPPEAIPTQTASGESSLIEIYFFRSARHTDEASTDAQGFPLADNFTPYIFTDNVLTDIGWSSLLTLKIRKPDPHPRAEPQPLCKQLGPLAGCF